MNENAKKPENEDLGGVLFEKEEKPELREIADEKLEKILEDHKKWAQTKGKDGKQGDLSYCILDGKDFSKRILDSIILAGSSLINTSFRNSICINANFKYSNLERSLLSEGNFRKSDFSGANLKQVQATKTIFNEATFNQANLQKSQLQRSFFSNALFFETDLSDSYLSNVQLDKAIMTGANLQNAELYSSILLDCSLHRASLSGSNLHSADLTGAKLRSADLINAKLEKAKLINATLDNIKNLHTVNLHNCNFEGATGLKGTEFSRADITGAKLPEDIRGFKTLETVAEISINARKIFLAMLLACVYSWLTIASTTDVNLLTNSASSPLPIIGTPIPIAWFYFAAPLLLIGFYFYLHLYLRRYWEGLAGLPARFEDGRRLDERAHPWLLNGLVRRHFEKLKNERTFFMKIEEWVNIILAWYFVPFTLFWFWLRYLRRHDWGCTGLHIGLIILSIIAGIFFYRSHAITLRGDKADKSGDKKEDGVGKKKISLKEFLYNSRTYKYGLAIPSSVLLIILSYGAINGVTDRAKRFPIDQYSFLRVNVPKLFEFFKYDVFADFGEKTVSSRPENYWIIKPEERGNAVSGANLAYADLRHADAFMAFLDKVDLRGARLDAVDLRGAKLRHAKLWGASLQWAYLMNADLEGANLKWADLSYAHMARINLKRANLDSSIIKGAHLVDANLDSTYLRWANLDSVDLEKANLIGAHLQGANIWNSYLGGANLAFALLIKANIVYTNLQQVNLSSANLESAYLERANLQSALMYDATLDSANLKYANLSGANLQYAKGLTTEQLDRACGDSLTILPDYLKDYKMKPCPCEEDTTKSPGLNIN